MGGVGERSTESPLERWQRGKCFPKQPSSTGPTLRLHRGRRPLTAGRRAPGRELISERAKKNNTHHSEPGGAPRRPRAPRTSGRAVARQDYRLRGNRRAAPGPSPRQATRGRAAAAAPVGLRVAVETPRCRGSQHANRREGRRPPRSAPRRQDAAPAQRRAGLEGAPAGCRALLRPDKGTASGHRRQPRAPARYNRRPPPRARPQAGTERSPRAPWGRGAPGPAQRHRVPAPRHRQLQQNS